MNSCPRICTQRLTARVQLKRPIIQLSAAAFIACLSVVIVSGDVSAQDAAPSSDQPVEDAVPSNSDTGAQDAPSAASPDDLPPVVIETDGDTGEASPSQQQQQADTVPPAAPQPPSQTAQSPVDDIGTESVGPGLSTDEQVEAAQSGEPADGATTGRGTTGIDGYFATGTSTATKTNTSLIDIPQSISVVTKDFIQDTGTYSVGRALEYVPGVTVQQGEGHRDQITIRGQETTADFFTDGVRDDIQYYRDLYNVEAIEVLKGSTAMIFGRGGGGGVVNRVTKKANGESIYYGSSTLGSFGKRYFTADVGQAVSDTFAVRLNAMYEDSESFRNFFEVERVGINPTATLELGPNTRVLASYEYRKDDRTVDRGVTSQNGLPIEGFRSSFFGNPDVSFATFDGHVATLTFEHEFNAGPSIRSHFSWNKYDKFYQNIMPGSALGATAPDSFLIGGRAGDNDAGGYNSLTERESVFSQTDISHQFNTGSQVRHTVVAGMEFSNQDNRLDRFVPFYPDTGTPGIQVPITNPTNFATVQFNERTRNRHTTTQVTSFYAQDQIEITKFFEVIGGIRWDRFDVDFEELDDGVQINRVDEEWSPRVGAIVKPIDGVSLYVSWSKSFLPSSGDQFDNIAVNRRDLAPEEFENREVGFKAQVMPRLLLTGALFDLDRTNQPVTIDGAGTQAAAGETNTRGGEIGLTGYITDEWQINLGYSTQRSKIEDAGTNVARVGNSVEGVPRHIFSIWNRYQFTDMIAVGAGVVHQSDHFAAANNAVEVPGYTRVDAAMFFDITENWEAQVNVENLFNTDYFRSAHNNFNISPGAPRSVFVTVSGKF